MAERYNLIVGYVNKHDKATREFVSYLIRKMIPSLKTMDLSELKEMLDFIDA